MLDSVIGEYPGQNPAPGPMHRIDGKPELRPPDQGEVGELANSVDVGRLQINFFNRGRAAAGHRPAMQLVFDDLHDGGRRRSAEFALGLDAIPVPGVVTGGDYHSAGGTLCFHGVGNCRGWRVVIGEFYRDSGVRDYFGHQPRYPLRCKASVVADNHAPAAFFMLQNVGGDCSGDAAHVFEGKVVRDDSPPSVSPKLYFSHEYRATFYRHRPLDADVSTCDHIISLLHNESSQQRTESLTPAG